MLNIHKLQSLLRAICLLFTLSGVLSFALADDLSDAKNAYGAGQFEEAATLLRPLVRQENMAAVYLLARMYEQGDGVEKDLVEAKRLYRIAAQEGSDDAQQRLDIFDAQGADDSVVIEWYLPSAEEGDTEAQYNLGFMYETGWGVRVNEVKAVQWYQEASEMQHDIAQLRLGMMLVTGSGVAQSVNDGITLIRHSSENGNTVAESLIQNLFDADDVEIEDAIRIVTGIRRVLDEGEAQTLETLRRSIELLHKPIESTDTISTIKTLTNQPRRIDIVKVVTGTESVSVSSTPRNKKPDINDNSSIEPGTSRNGEATRASAATQVLPQDQHSQTQSKVKNLQLLSAQNDAPRGNLFLWYLNMASQGDADSQYHAGAMYVKGEQVEQDIEEGVRWIKLAAEQGHEMSVTYLKLWDENFSVNTFESSVAVRWLKGAGREFDLDAIFNLAFLYETGRGVSRNFNTAQLWYKFASVEGHEEAKRRLALLKKRTSGTNAVTSEASENAEPDMPVIIGLFIILFICVGIYFYYQRAKGAQIPSAMAEISENDVIKQAKNTAGLQVDDKKFFDELWDAPGSNGLASGATEESKNSGARKGRSPTDAEKKATELSEVEQKLSKAIDDLMSIGQKSEVSSSQKEKEGKGAVKPQVGNDSMVSAKAKSLSKSQEKPQKKSSIAEESIDIVTDKAARHKSEKENIKAEGQAQDKVKGTHNKVGIKEYDRETKGANVADDLIINAKKEQRKFSPVSNGEGEELSGVGEYAAESFLSNGISMDELAAGRVSADSLFADGIAIDEAGTAIGRGGYNPRKLNADEMLGVGGISLEMSITKNEISGLTSMTRPVGAAASLLPQQESASKQAQKTKQKLSSHSTPKLNLEVTSTDDILAESSGEPVDVSGPMTNSEERSLSEVHYNIGLMFSEGDGVPQNEAQAAKWFLKAAEEGMAEAQFNIGQRYLTGLGVAKDLALGTQWMQKSADNNYKPAQKELQKKNRAS